MSITVEKLDEPVLDQRVMFSLHFRSVDEGVMPKVECSEPFVLDTNTGILCCPWCGTRLYKHYAKCFDALVEFTHRNGAN